METIGVEIKPSFFPRSRHKPKPLVSVEENLEKVIDLSTFTEDPKLGDNIPFLIQLKGFNRTERIKRRIEQTDKKQFGSALIRQIADGGIFAFRNFKKGIYEGIEKWKYYTQDTRGLAIKDDNIFLGSVDKVQVIDFKGNEMLTIRNPWFAFIHSVAFSQDKKKLLVVSSGFDRIIELDSSSHQVTWNWVAWNHGYNRAKMSGKFIVTDENKTPTDENVLVIKDPKDFPGGLGLPPADRTAFPNSAIYFDENSILATLYHNGLIKIDKITGEVSEILSGLKHPHSVIKTDTGFMVTNTGDSSCILLDKNLKPTQTIIFNKLPGNAVDFEWLQQVRPFGKNLLAAVDSNRASIYIIDLKRRKIRRQQYYKDWVVQEIFPLYENPKNSNFH